VWPFLVGIPLWLLLWGWFAKKGWLLGKDALQRAATELPAGVLILGALATWTAQPVGVFVAAAAAGVKPGADPATRSLRDMFWLQAGGYGASLAVAAALCFILPGFARAVGAARASRHDWLRTPVIAGAWFALVIPVVYAVGAASLWIARRIAEWTGAPVPGENAHETLARLSDTGSAYSGWWWAMVLAVTVGAPLVEELIYRGMLQTGLAKLTRRPLATIAITSALFALAHASVAAPHALPTLFVLSLGFGLALERTGKLWVSVLMHAGFNAMNVWMAVG